MVHHSSNMTHTIYISHLNSYYLLLISVNHSLCIGTLHPMIYHCLGFIFMVLLITGAKTNPTLNPTTIQTFSYQPYCNNMPALCWHGGTLYTAQSLCPVIPHRDCRLRGKFPQVRRRSGELLMERKQNVKRCKLIIADRYWLADHFFSRWQLGARYLGCVMPQSGNGDGG